jgi:hypothetical protein
LFAEGAVVTLGRWVSLAEYSVALPHPSAPLRAGQPLGVSRRLAVFRHECETGTVELRRRDPLTGRRGAVLAGWVYADFATSELIYRDWSTVGLIEVRQRRGPQPRRPGRPSPYRDAAVRALHAMYDEGWFNPRPAGFETRREIRRRVRGDPRPAAGLGEDMLKKLVRNEKQQR